MNTLNIFAHSLVNSFSVADISNIDHQLDKMGHVPASLLNQLADILHHLVSLFYCILAIYIFGVIEVLWALATHPYSPPTVCNDRLTQIIVKILFGICVFGIEFTDTVMRHQENLHTMALH